MASNSVFPLEPQEMGKRLIFSQTGVSIRCVRIGVNSDGRDLSESGLNSAEHALVAAESMIDVSLQHALWLGDNRAVTGEDEMRVSSGESAKLFDVDVHVARVRWDEDGPKTCHHVTCHQARLTQQADVAGVMARRDQHFPALSSELQDLTVNQDSVTGHAQMGVLAPPDGDFKRFP